MEWPWNKEKKELQNQYNVMGMQQLTAQQDEVNKFKGKACKRCSVYFKIFECPSWAAGIYSPSEYCFHCLPTIREEERVAVWVKNNPKIIKDCMEKEKKNGRSKK